jgi:hypothetical protein
MVVVMKVSWRTQWPPELPLKKEHIAICYHCCRESLAAGFVQLAREHTKTNLAEAPTNLLTSPRRCELLLQILL